MEVGSPVARGSMPLAVISAESSSIVLRCSMAALRISAKAAGSASACECAHLENGGEHDATRPKTLLELEHLLLQFIGAFASLDCHDERRVDAGRAQRLDQERGWIELEH